MSRLGPPFGAYQVVKSIVERNAIPTSSRFEGMEVVVAGVSDGYATSFQLLGGIGDGNWLQKDFNGSLTLATHADLATVSSSMLVVGREFTVNSDGTKWTYTGNEPAAPDPTVESAWEITGPALASWFADPAFPLADSRDVFVDAATGSDVFNDGTTGQPFANLNRALAAIPEIPNASIIGPAGFSITYTVEYQGTGKADLTSVSTKFATTTKFFVDVLGARNAVDLDGYGTTELSAAVFNRDLTGPVGSGGTVLKQSQYRLGTGVNLLASVQQPAADGMRFLYKEFSFGIPGLRFKDAANNARVHDAGTVMGPQDLGIVGGAFNRGFTLGDVTNVLSDYVTQVDGTLPGFFPWLFDNVAKSVSLKFIGIDFATDTVLQGKSNGIIDGNVSFNACKFKVGGAQQNLRVHTSNTHGRFLFQNCTFIGEGLFNNFDYVVIDGSAVSSSMVLFSNLFLNAALVLGNGTWEPYMNIYRGIEPPQGNNGNAARLIIGSTDLSTDRGVVTGCGARRVSGDFERAPGDLTPMKTGVNPDLGACVIAIGTGTTFQLNGSQGNTSLDIIGRAYEGVFGAALTATDQWAGEVTRPMLLRTAAHVADNQYNGNVTRTMISVVNTTGTKAVPGGGDVQLGFLPTGSIQTETVKDWADLPATDIAHGDESEGVFWR